MAATVGMVMMVTALVPMIILAIIIMVAMVITALVVVPTLSMVPTPTQSPLLQLETAPEYRSMQSAPNATFLVKEIEPVWKFALLSPAMAFVPPPAESVFCPPPVLKYPPEWK